MKKKLLTLFLSVLAIAGFSQYIDITFHPVKLQYPGNVIQQLNPVDSMVVWGVAYCTDTVAAHEYNNVEMLRSVNSGLSWQSYVIPHSSIKDSATFSCFWPISATKCFAGFYKTTNSGGQAVSTSDGGLTWQPVNFGANAFTGGFFDFMYFFTPDSGIAVGNPNHGYFEIYTTANGGQNWSRVDSANIPRPLNNEYGFGYEFNFTSDTFSFPTNLNRILYTADKGKTWKAYFLPGGTATSSITNNSGLFVGYLGNPKIYATYRMAANPDYKNVVYYDTAVQNYGSMFKTKTDDALFVVSTDTAGVTYLDESEDTAGVMSGSWGMVTGGPPFVTDNMYKTYFYSKNLGWLINSKTLLPKDTILYITRYARCQPPASSSTPIGNICNPAQTSFFSNYFSPAASSFFLVSDSLYNSGGDIFIVDSNINLSTLPYGRWRAGYYYMDSFGCVAEQGQFFFRTDAAYPQATLALPFSIVCTNSSPITLSGGTPAGGMYSYGGTIDSVLNTAIITPGQLFIKYTYTDSNLCSNSDSESVTVHDCTPVIAVNADADLTVYPNPSSNNWQLTVDEALIGGRVEIFDATGQLVLQSQVKEYQSTIHIDNAASGIYELRITSRGNTVVKKLIRL